MVILVGNMKCRTQFWKGTTQGSFQQSLVEIGSVVSEEKIFSKFHPPFFLFLAWWPSWLEVGITRHNFGRGPSKDHSTRVWLQLAQWFLRRSLKCEMLMDGRRTKSDDNSSHGLTARWAKNCSVGRSWHAAHFCNLNLTFISYSCWNIRRKVLKFLKFDEKRAITPRWVMGFSSKLQSK